ncbi:NAD(P)-dependent oxidoreductase [Aeromonas sp. 43P]|uniref:NAD(P)-dependent oxidoreductase n=1 Tax=Aeromonas sp. 43P TaxID=3115854 RepID=UPI003FA542A1
MAGFGCALLAYDPYPNPAVEALGGRYVPLDELLAESDIVSLHCPLNDGTRYLVNSHSLQRMKRGAMLRFQGHGQHLGGPEEGARRGGLPAHRADALLGGACRLRALPWA